MFISGRTEHANKGFEVVTSQNLELSISKSINTTIIRLL